MNRAYSIPISCSSFIRASPESRQARSAALPTRVHHTHARRSIITCIQTHDLVSSGVAGIIINIGGARAGTGVGGKWMKQIRSTRERIYVYAEHCSGALWLRRCARLTCWWLRKAARGKRARARAAFGRPAICKSALHHQLVSQHPPMRWSSSTTRDRLFNGKCT